MIHVDRSNVPKPDWWDGPEFRRFLSEWEDFHLAGGTRATQMRMGTHYSGGELEVWKQRALPTLLEGFHFKCPYTEASLEEAAAVVFHRPEADAIGLESDISPEHYWWCVADWDNWFPTLPRVVHRKGTSFPVVGPRLGPPPWADGSPDPLRLDRGLILDPSRDHPAWHLSFQSDGTVQPREHPGPKTQRLYRGHSRGEVTIHLLGLNDPELVLARQAMREEFDVSLLIEDRLEGTADPDDEFLIHPRTPFAGSSRQAMADELVAFLGENRLGAKALERVGGLVVELAEELAARMACEGSPQPLPGLPREFWRPLRPVVAREWPELDFAGFESLITGEAPPAPRKRARRKPAATRTRRISDDALGAPEVSGAAPEAPFTSTLESHLTSKRVVERTARVTGVEIENFKAIETLTLELDDATDELPVPFDPAAWLRRDEEAAPIQATRWTAFLGENGSGKSSCLEAIALALAADRLDELVEEAELDWSSLLRRGADRGSVRLHLGEDSILHLEFTREGPRWLDADGADLFAPPKMAAYVRGYGATRLLDGGPIDGVNEHVRLANLFDPHAQVLDAQKWLLGLDEGDFHVAATTLGGFLEDDRTRVPGTDRVPLLRPDETRQELFWGGDRLTDLSDGYRAIITLVCDIMAGLGAGLSNLRNATGIVLIDELGSHLHPRWKMEITSRLRRELPNVQFFVSTHEPLCLRGMFGGEVVRVRKRIPERAPGEPFQPGSVEREVIERSPSDYRVDQLLTSEFFGLDTTIDPDLDRRFQAYYQLLAMTPEERLERGVDDDRLGQLRADVQARSQPVLGFTRRDQLVYEAIDEYMSREGEMTVEERRDARSATLKSIQDIWREREAIAAGRGSRG